MKSVPRARARFHADPESHIIHGMCGICGIVDFNRPITDGAERVRAMNRTLRHRGPDDEGELTRPHAVLAMRRLSIIDMANGRQPISSENNSFHIIYNGETFNFRDLREDLVARGHVFRTATDTESVLHAVEESWADALELFNGMFAFAVYDEPGRRMLLARDRLGIKPLYYHYAAGRLYFASEIKALLAHPDVPRDLDPEALALFLAHLYIPGERTIYRHIRRLAPGHYLDFQGGEPAPVRWWSLPREPAPISAQDAEQQLADLIEDAVRVRLISEAPLGAFLSGGVDSSLVTALMCRAASGRVRTFSIRFPERGFDETPFAAAVARHCGAAHQVFDVDFPSVPDMLPRLARAFDQPFADPSAIPAFVLCEQARPHITVALSGNGGDELFGGYTKYLADRYARVLALAPAALRRAALSALDRALGESPDLGDRTRRIKRVLKYSLASDRIRAASWTTGFDIGDQKALWRADALREAPIRDIFEPIMRHVRHAGRFDVTARRMIADILTYLPDNNLLKDDITGMANSLEVRVPLLDYRVAALAASLPTDLKVRNGELKFILKKVAARFLPEEILNRPKQGFTVPVGHWINKDLAGYADELLLAGVSPLWDYFEKPAVARLLRAHRAGRADHSLRLWALMTLRVWFDENGRM